MRESEIKEMKELVNSKAVDGKVLLYTDVESVQFAKSDGYGICLNIHPIVDLDVDVEVEVDVDQLEYDYDEEDKLVFIETKDGAEIKVKRFL